MGIRKHVTKIALVVIGSVIAAFALEKILLPENILDGGVVGVSIIVDKLVHFLPLGFVTILLNLPFVVAGGKKLGKFFFIYTVTGMATFSLFLSVFAQYEIVLTDDMLLASVFGGVLLGVGVGIVIKNGGCLDGTEAAAILLSGKIHMPVGQIVLIFNIVLYTVAGFLFGFNSALYSMITYFVASRVVDYIDVGLDQAKAVMIITNEGKKIAEDIYQQLGRTVTLIEGTGLVSGEKTVLYCVITRLELGALRRIIEGDDVSAFITVSDVSEIIGRHIKSREKAAELVFEQEKEV